uniref:Putative secreted protein n=1 Tax=Anopheles triannulatus TaxID=58253 RepID=A0A2M4B0W6_9DIPT
MLLNRIYLCSSMSFLSALMSCSTSMPVSSLMRFREAVGDTLPAAAAAVATKLAVPPELAPTADDGGNAEAPVFTYRVLPAVTLGAMLPPLPPPTTNVLAAAAAAAIPLLTSTLAPGVSTTPLSADRPTFPATPLHCALPAVRPAYATLAVRALLASLLPLQPDTAGTGPVTLLPLPWGSCCSTLHTFAGIFTWLAASLLVLCPPLPSNVTGGCDKDWFCCCCWCEKLLLDATDSDDDVGVPAGCICWNSGCRWPVDEVCTTCCCCCSGC